jgi:hypothetical protein
MSSGGANFMRMGHKPLFCVVRCDAQQIGARKPQFFNEKMTIERDLDASRLIGQDVSGERPISRLDRHRSHYATRREQ